MKNGRLVLGLALLVFELGCNDAAINELAERQRGSAASQAQAIIELKAALADQRSAIETTRRDLLVRLEALDARLKKLQTTDQALADLVQAAQDRLVANEAQQTKFAIAAAAHDEQARYRAVLERFSKLDAQKQAQIAAAIKRVRSGEADKADYDLVAEYGNEYDQALVAKWRQEQGEKELKRAGVE